MMGGLNDAEQPAVQPSFSLVEKPPISLESGQSQKRKFSETVNIADMFISLS